MCVYIGEKPSEVSSLLVSEALCTIFGMWHLHLVKLCSIFVRYSRERPKRTISKGQVCSDYHEIRLLILIPSRTRKRKESPKVRSCCTPPRSYRSARPIFVVPVRDNSGLDEKLLTHNLEKASYFGSCISVWRLLTASSAASSCSPTTGVPGRSSALSWKADKRRYVLLDMLCMVITNVIASFKI